MSLGGFVKGTETSQAGRNKCITPADFYVRELVGDCGQSGI
jgi:hypothetical protein